MGADYALVHLKYTIPPAVFLTLLYWPLSTRLDVYKILFLITIAVVSTIPWDSYLIRTGIWSYPANVILGPTLFAIPLEEVFFFIIQTYNTTLLYLLCSKPTLHAEYLIKEKIGRTKWKYIKFAGQGALALGIKKGIEMVRSEGPRTYLGLIIIWAFPFLFLLWSLSYQLLVGLPWTKTVLPVALPTSYLWMVDTLALKRGTWSISSGTKTGWTLWPGLEIEEAVFFLLTNALIVAGLVAFDNGIAVLNAFPAQFSRLPALPSPAMLVRALLVPSSAYEEDRIEGLKQAVDRLRRKSRSFYLASGIFTGRLRIDLVHLYSFCRVADDLVDSANSIQESKQWIDRLQTFLDLSYSQPLKKNDGSMVCPNDPNQGQATLFAVRTFPEDSYLALLLLPTDRLEKAPLYELLAGFRMDLEFSSSKPGSSPIKSDSDLDLYGKRVAGTVAELCIQLVFFHYPGNSSKERRKESEILASGQKMGIALQYVNIARDLAVDAAIGRCYVPPGWLKREKMTAESLLQAFSRAKLDDFVHDKIERIRSRLLDRAFDLYEQAMPAIEELPNEARAPMRVAVESYMQIGRELRRSGYQVKAGRATVPNWKRIWVAWRALSKG